MITCPSARWRAVDTRDDASLAARVAEHGRPRAGLRRRRGGVRHPVAVQSRLPRIAIARLRLRERAGNQRLVDCLRAGDPHDLEHRGAHRAGREPDTRTPPRTVAGSVGLATTAVIFVAGCAMLFVFQQQDPFVASRAQLVGSAVVVVVLVAVAVGLGRVERATGSTNTASTATKHAPNARVVGATAFMLGSTFMSLSIVHDVIPAALNAAGMVGLVLLGGGLFLRWSSRPGWSSHHDFAVPAGLLLTYV